MARERDDSSATTGSLARWEPKKKKKVTTGESERERARGEEQEGEAAERSVPKSEEVGESPR